MNIQVVANTHTELMNTNDNLGGTWDVLAILVASAFGLISLDLQQAQQKKVCFHNILSNTYSLRFMRSTADFFFAEEHMENQPVRSM